MKKILMSIHPEWCEKIFNGEKTIEVRKTRPKLEPPFEVYVYCTRSRLHLYKNPNNGEVFLDRLEGYRGGDYENRYITGKVIGSFVCDDISPIDYIRYWNNGIEIEFLVIYLLCNAQLLIFFEQAYQLCGFVRHVHFNASQFCCILVINWFASVCSLASSACISFMRWVKSTPSSSVSATPT